MPIRILNYKNQIARCHEPKNKIQDTNKNKNQDTNKNQEANNKTQMLRRNIWVLLFASCYLALAICFLLFASRYASLPWQFLNFLPLPQGQGSFRPILGSTFTGCGFCPSCGSK
jgi:hypothetical protein